MKKTDRRGPPRQVPFRLGEVLHRELYGFAFWAGLEVLGARLEEEREEACGPRYCHLAGRRAYRSGHAPGAR